MADLKSSKTKLSKIDRVNARIDRIKFCIDRTKDTKAIDELTAELAMREAELVVENFRAA